LVERVGTQSIRGGLWSTSEVRLWTKEADRDLWVWIVYHRSIYRIRNCSGRSASRENQRERADITFSRFEIEWWDWEKSSDMEEAWQIWTKTDGNRFNIPWSEFMLFYAEDRANSRFPRIYHHETEPSQTRDFEWILLRNGYLCTSIGKWIQMWHINYHRFHIYSKRIWWNHRFYGIFEKMGRRKVDTGSNESANEAILEYFTQISLFWMEFVEVVRWGRGKTILP
jgi:hypothetical protein